MAINFLISDAVTRINNAVKRSRAWVDVPSSKYVVEVIKVLKTEKYIADFRKISDGKKNTLRIMLKYISRKKPIITGLKIISKPSIRFYRGYDEMPSLHGGLGKIIVSTSKGVMTTEEARKIKQGGELILKVW